MEENRKEMMERYVKHIYPNAVFVSFLETTYGTTELKFWVDDEYYVCMEINGMILILKMKKFTG